MDQCPECGARIKPADAVCPGCGARIEGPTQSFEALNEAAAPIEVAEVEVSDVPALVVLKGPEVGERFYLEQSEVTIGRDPKSDIFLNDVTVSRRHARLRVDGDTVTIVDVGSLNGTYVNDEVVTEARLNGGDTVQIGRFQMVFVSGGGAG